MNKFLVNFGLFVLAASCVVCAPNDGGKPRGVVEEADLQIAELVKPYIGERRVVSKALQKYLKDSDYQVIKDLTREFDKHKDKCADIEKKMNDTIDDLANCIEDITIGDSTVCATAQRAIEKCAKPVIELVSGCLPDESKELPALAEGVVLAIWKQACASTVEQVLELFNPCQWKSFSSLEKIESCKAVPTEVESWDHSKQLPTTENICTLLPKIKKCSSDFHGQYCKNPVTLSSFAKFHKAIETETEKICHDPVKNEVA
ncbi:uncharacterized protein LOC114339675 [Diabrotica virgifera virgifera]|uniref:Uncharacterized protein LOC114339675 n=1 Tax=Diabrotica virgifera virgifera TaxID=50390 RepID=A0A6P7GLP4_DIAVI|nr:uncharacterized protein LOC114339675 [Diabrotica virgifera virgifera]